MRSVLLLLLAVGLFVNGVRVARTPDWFEKRYPGRTEKIRRLGGSFVNIICGVVALVEAIKGL
jgi:hypothetical protein